ncbi:non-ribosomal peptide synthetase [Polyangium sp. 6x1]|uniref:non-ribosomal peptide synthetase n=1 Tax=Polyangium sp. 6x1 TaxID=3042689 RepID=UPI0024826AA5|nr:non-ribosomal peptide synthetase [Polyangium sp. 6x1]MDI1443026.1 amino acid adenylation domain-containing protein [Polyangium sp. 6x1]
MKDELAERLSRLSPEKRALVEKRLRGERIESAPRFVIPRRPGNGPGPLSFSQQRLWFIQELDKESAAFNEIAVLHLSGPLDTAAFERAIHEIVRRHEILRTTFMAPEGTPAQIVAREVGPCVSFVDLGRVNDAEKDEEVRRRIEAEAARPFDLATGPLFRVTVLALSAAEHVAIFANHHIVSDAWSRGIMLRELAALYAAFTKGAPSPLPELDLQYADFAHWQRETFGGQALEEQLAYWRRQLGGPLPVLELPADRPRPAGAAHRAGALPVHVPKPLSEALEALARSEKATLFVAVLSAFGILLRRYAGQEDILVGTPIAARSRTQIEPLIGFFVNNLVMRLDLTSSPSFRELLRRTREVATGAFARQDVPFEKLVEELQPTRDPSRSPLFQAMLSLRNVPQQPLEIPGLAVRTLDAHLPTARFDFTLDLGPVPDGLSGFVEYSAELFDESTIERMMEHFSTIVREVVADPERPIDEIPLLSQAERHRILSAWNATETPVPRSSCVHHAFELQVARTPDAQALVFGDRALTFRELDARANRLAHALQKEGVGPEVLVGIHLDRSLEMVVAMLGVLKAGGAYVPLDPSYPRQRLEYIVEHTGLGVIVAMPGTPSIAGARRVRELSPEDHALARFSPDAPASGVDPKNLVYVIFTSGSTGKPKGVMVTHANVVNFMAGMDAHVPHENPGTWLAVTSISFDISVLEIFWALSRGFRVVVQPEQGAPGVSRSGELAGRARSLEFSLFYFASAGAGDAGDKYRLLLEGARFADENGFSAVWTPERHFHAFGGLFPNPSVTAAALAASTKRVGIRAGSVVMPLHDPIRVAEEWAVVDNISEGRVGLSFASGWHADDFVFAPERFRERREEMYVGIDIVRRLWRGEVITRKGGAGQDVRVSTLPLPRQRELPFWVTASGDPATFRKAGEIGANVLTHLLGQTTEELAEKIAIYREAWKAHGHGPGEGHVTLMLHTFVGTDLASVREIVRDPFCNYLRSSVDLVRRLARSIGRDIDAEDFTEDDLDALMRYAYNRYFETGGLFGTPESCLPTVERLAALGVNEIGCLVDFGIDTDAVLSSLDHLATLMHASRRPATDSATDSMGASLRKHAVSHLQCTPSMARLMLAAGEEPPAERPLRALMLGGEALPPDVARQVRPWAADVLNLYGPTETTVWSTVWRLSDGGASISIGRPIANTRVYVLDARLSPVPLGVVGELYIGGDGVARGYHGDAAQTEERFLRDPFVEVGDARMYRTGDLARFRADGQLEYVGRADQQVKVRGHRIELGEIEGALANLPGVREAAVAAMDDGAGGKQLVAYVVSRAHPRPSHAEMRRALGERLPAYMVPSIFADLEALPLTPNGKLDRRALPNPERARTTPEAEFTAPRTDIERKLGGIWGEVLGRERVGIHDNFFELGGHSLLAAQIVARVRSAFAVELPLRRFLESPTIAGVAPFLEQGRAEPTPDAAPALVPDVARRYEPFPLTDVQQAYWIGRSGIYELGNVACHLYVEFEAVDLDLGRLGTAFQRVIERHDMLRAVVQPDGQQRILERTEPYVIRYEDLSGEPAEARAARLDALRHEMSHHVLPADRWPLFDFRASRIDARRIRLHFSIDTLIADGGSVDLLLRDLSRWYADPTWKLDPLDASFRDYVLLLAGQEGDAAHEKALAYWRERIASLPPAPELPLAQDPGSIDTTRFVRRQARLEPERWSRLKRRAQQAGLTPSGVVLAAYADVLAAWSASPSFTLNLTLFNRLPVHPQIHQVVGDFTSLCLLAVDQRVDAPFEARARRLQQRLWEDLDHRRISGVRVLRELARQGVDAKMPVVFTSELGDTSADELAESLPLVGEVTYTITQTPQVWLDHQVRQLQGGLHLSWDAVEELFPEGMLGEMFDAYVKLLQRLSDDEGAWQDVERALLPSKQWEARAEVNRTEAPVPAGLLHEPFLSQVRAQPWRTAIFTEDRTLTYEEVQARALGLARALRADGARPNRLVAVVMEKGWEQVVAVLAILQAGGAYLPIDPDLPAERIHFLLKDGAVEHVLTQSWVDERLPWPESVRRTRVDEAKAASDDALLAPVQRPEDLAYVIYTSGSTGQPKGVMIDHRGALNTIVDINQRFGVTPQDRVLALSSLSFDLSVYDVFGALAAGATIVLPAANAKRDPGRWAGLLQQAKVTLWNSVPALMELLAAHAEGKREKLGDDLRLVMLSGDWIPVALPDRVRALAPRAEVVSLGGATEASIWSILHPIGTVAPEWKSIPYGKPMVNQTFHVLDEALSPRPTWVPGRLYIGGIGLARGYWGDEEKTRARFLTHPRTGERLYHTGDLGRYLPDGTIEFLGREDFQVKIQGYRIELGEIESTLARHPKVRDAAVVVATDKAGARRLVAYVVPQEPAAAPAERPVSQAAEQGAPPALAAAAGGAAGYSLIDNPLERLKFKLRQPGMRSDLAQAPSVALDAPEMNDALLERFHARRSHQRFAQERLPLSDLSALLSCLMQAQIDGMPKLRYPSAGGLYPVQVYVYVKRDSVEGLGEGVYYHHPLEHRLLRVAEGPVLDESMYGEVNRPIFDSAAFAILMISRPSAIAPLYGELSPAFCALEAGYMGQLLMTEASERRLGLCPIGGVSFAQMRERLALEADQVLLHSLLGGRALPSAARVEAAAAAPASVAATPLDRELREYAAERLPDYMVPSVIKLLPSLPLTANGKVDRQALPKLEQQAPVHEAKVHEQPTGKIEILIAEAWQEVLGVAQVGVDDNFFELGGHSLHMVRLQAKLRDTLAQEVAILDLLEHPTVRALAQKLTQAGQDGALLEKSREIADRRRQARQGRRGSR